VFGENNSSAKRRWDKFFDIESPAEGEKSMEFRSTLDDQRDALAVKLASFPEFRLVASGAIPDSILNRFRIRHAVSRKWIEVRSFAASDFSMPKFEIIFDAFVEDCRSSSESQEGGYQHV
jgi:hypothetical protein